MVHTALAEAGRTARVLVFAVDDGCFCIHLDWVEAVYQRVEAPLHAVKDGDRAGHFLLHRGQPALAVDLREAFGLSPLLGSTERAVFLVVRAGSFLLALQIDACIGVRDLDLRTQVPVATGLVRDGGLSVGHLVELDGKLHGLLEPSRILSTTQRDQLEPLMREATAFRDRQEKLLLLGDELRREPTLAALKTYGRLSRRNGRTKVAAAARQILKAAQESERADQYDHVEGDLAGDGFVRDLILLSNTRQTGEVEVALAGGEVAKVFVDMGRIADAVVGGEWGRGAFKRILATREGTYRFNASETPVRPQRIDDATLWLLLETMEQLSEERRGRHLR